VKDAGDVSTAEPPPPGHETTMLPVTTVTVGLVADCVIVMASFAPFAPVAASPVIPIDPAAPNAEAAGSTKNAAAMAARRRMTEDGGGA